MVSDTLAPFVISFIFAYLLQPIIDNISQSFKFSKELNFICNICTVY